MLYERTLYCTYEETSVRLAKRGAHFIFSLISSNKLFQRYYNRREYVTVILPLCKYERVVTGFVLSKVTRKTVQLSRSMFNKTLLAYRVHQAHSLLDAANCLRCTMYIHVNSWN